MTVPALAAALLAAGLLAALVLLAQASAVQHLSADDIPGVLRDRVERCTRVRPYLLAGGLVLVALGLLLASVD
jgi:hypothetical protein